MTEKTKFTIKRSEWGRAPWGKYIHLYDADTGKMCCLGFFCEQVAGWSRDVMAGEVDPRELWDELKEEGIPDRPFWLDSLNMSRLIDLNDRQPFYDEERLNLPPEEQERLIAEEFAKGGYEVVFKD